MADPAIDTANVSAQAPNEQTQNAPITGSLMPPNPAPIAMQQPAAPAAPAIPPHIGKLAAAGHIFNTLAGKQTEYSIDPKTGATIATPVQRKPGEMFRSMLAGALMGGAAGAGHDFATGAAIGGNAVLQDQRQQDLIRRGQAQEQFKNQREVRKEDQEEMVRAAEIAHYHIANLQIDAQMDLMQQEHLDKLNEHNATIAKELGDKGVPANISYGGQNINGKMDNGGIIQKMLTENPQSFQAQPGTQRIHTQTVDYSGLKFNPETKGWVDEKGNKVDLADRTTHTFYDIATSDLNKPIQVPGSKVNSLLGYKQYDDKANLTMTTGDLVNMTRQANLQNLTESKIALDKQLVQLDIAKTSAEMAKTKKEMASMDKAEQAAAYEVAKVSMKTAEDKFKNLKDQFVSKDDPAYKDAEKDLNDARDDFEAVTKQIYGKNVTPPKKEAEPTKFDLPKGEGKVLTDPAIQQAYLKAAGGDRVKAQQLAIQNGWAAPPGTGPIGIPGQELPSLGSLNNFLNLGNTGSTSTGAAARAGGGFIKK